MLDLVIDTLIDSAKLLPFLFVTYLLMELLEHGAGGALVKKISAVDKAGPLWGAAFGVVPQCGFSAAASSLFAGTYDTENTRNKAVYCHGQRLCGGVWTVFCAAPDGCADGYPCDM